MPRSPQMTTQRRICHRALWRTRTLIYMYTHTLKRQTAVMHTAERIAMRKQGIL